MQERVNQNSEENLNQIREENNELTLERLLETFNLDVDLTLKHCVRKSVQPRKYLEQSINKERMIKLYGQQKVDEIMQSIRQIRDFDLTDEKEIEIAKYTIIDFFQPLVELRNSDENVKKQIEELMGENKNITIDVGIFQYVVQGDEEKKQIVLHIPPTIKTPGLREIRSSLKELAQILENDKNIVEVRCSSLLLEHPLVQKLGFNIDPKSDEGLIPNFHMSREEFLKKFG